jgi:hypothetical protein
LYVFFGSVELRFESRTGDLMYVSSINLSILQLCPLTTPYECLYREVEGTRDVFGRAIERIIPRPRTF